MRKLLTLLFLLVAPCAFAGPFDPPPTDQSVNLLGIIFGSSIGNIPLGGAPNPILGDLMEKFNLILVVVAVFIVSYVSIPSVINTAHEGTAMGKKWSAVWIPMRSVAGMALMIPAPASGYSMIQVIVMWIIIQGIGAADILWNMALDGLSSGMSVSTGTTVGGVLQDSGDVLTIKDQGKILAEQILNAKTCMSTLYQSSLSSENQNPPTGGPTWLGQNGDLITDFSVVDDGSPSIKTPPTTCVSSTNSDGNTIPARYAEMSGIVYFGVDNPDPDERNLCGSIKVVGSVCSDEFSGFSGPTPSDQDLINIANEIYFTKLNMISSMLTVMQPIAEGFADEEYVQPLQEGATDPEQPPSGFIDQAITQYMNMIGGLVVQPPSGSTNAALTTLNQHVQKGKENGWIAAGSFYFVFNQTLAGQLYKSATEDTIETVEDIPTCVGTPCAAGFSTIPGPIENLIQSTDDQNTLAYNLGMANAYYVADESRSRSTIFRAPGAESSGEAAAAIGAISSFNGQALQDISNLLNTNDPSVDPLLSISYFGRSLMLGIEATIITIISLVLVIGMLTLTPDRIGLPFGSNIYLPKIYALMQTTVINLLAILAIFLPVFMVMWAYGAMLAVYVPLIPFMIFIMAAIGWMLTVVEAILAAPIVAIGFILPAGDDLGKIESALNILANVFLRPMLMIFGFFLASRVFKAVVMLINFGMGGVFDSINVSSLFSTLIIIAVYATFIISIANTSFSLIYALPDKILRWIGGATEHTDTSPVSEAKGTTQETAQTASESVREMGKAAGKPAIESAGKRLQDAYQGWQDKQKEKQEKDKQNRLDKEAIKTREEGKAANPEQAKKGFNAAAAAAQAAKDRQAAKEQKKKGISVAEQAAQAANKRQNTTTGPTTQQPPAAPSQQPPAPEQQPPDDGDGKRS